MDKLLQEYLIFWALTDPELITKTTTSHLYKVRNKGKIFVLKLYTKIGRIHEIRGPEFLFITRETSVQVRQFDRGACLLEYIDGPMLISFIGKDQNKEKDEEATLIMAKILNKIHKKPVPTRFQFLPVNNHMEDLYKYADTADDAPDTIKKAADFAHTIFANPKEDDALLHGDMHHRNVMRRGDEWVAIDPRGLVGERAYDCAASLHNPSRYLELRHSEDRLLKQVDIMSKEMNIDPQRIIDYGFIHGCVSACWARNVKDHYGRRAIKASQILEKHISTGK